MSGEIDSFLIDQIKRHEGYRRHPYKCTSGKLTIGIGRNLDDNGISEEEAEYLAVSDLKRSAAELNKTFPWYYSLSKRRKQALINFHFNVGLATMLKFKNFLAEMESGNYPLAAQELLDSQYAKQVKSRADELALQIVNG